MNEDVKDNLKTVLEEAQELINGDRKQQYGDAQQSFKRIAAYWSTYLSFPVKASDVAVMLTLMKISRNGNRYKRDSVIDAIGYLALQDQIQGGE